MSNRNWKGKSMKTNAIDYSTTLWFVCVARTRITNPPQDQSVIKGTKAAMTCGVTFDPSVTVRYKSTLLNMYLLSTLSKNILSFSSLSLSVTPCLISHSIFTCLFLPSLSCVFITFSLLRLDLTVTCWAAVIHLIRENGWICKQSNNLDGDFN